MPLPTLPGSLPFADRRRPGLMCAEATKPSRKCAKLNHPNLTIPRKTLDFRRIPLSGEKFSRNAIHAGLPAPRISFPQTDKTITKLRKIEPLQSHDPPQNTGNPSRLAGWRKIPSPSAIRRSPHRTQPPCQPEHDRTEPNRIERSVRIGDRVQPNRAEQPRTLPTTEHHQFRIENPAMRRAILAVGAGRSWS